MPDKSLYKISKNGVLANHLKLGSNTPTLFLYSYLL